MKYRTKILFILIVLNFVVLFISAGITYAKTKEKLFSLLRSEAIGIAATASTIIDPEEVKIVKNELNDKTPQFKSLAQSLRKFRNANRERGLYVKYTYIIEPNPKNPNEILVVADSTEGPDYAPPGTLYPEGIPIGILAHLNEPYAPHTIVKDRWASFLPGYAPIFDKDGQYVATLGINLSAESVIEKLSHLKWIFLISLAISALLGILAAAFLGKEASYSLSQISLGVGLIGTGKLDTRISLQTHDEFGSLASSINEMAEGLKEKDRLKTQFVHFVSKHVLEKIIKEGKQPEMGGEKKKVTILFCDIFNFTHLAETRPAEEVVSFLNDFLSVMVEVVLENYGTLDKFIGDGLMVEFGAPFDDPEQEMHAIQTAIHMQRSLIALNEKSKERGFTEIQMMIGIHTGDAILGNIGSDKRMEYTAIGDTVNTASRIENIAKEKNIPILISEETQKAVFRKVGLKDLGPVSLKGKAKEIRVFSVEY